MIDHSVHLDAGSAAWYDIWSPWALLLVLAVGFAYFWLIRTGTGIPGYSPVPVAKQIYFMIGLLLYWVAKGTPIAFYGHAYLFSAHMFQMSLLYLAMPPFLYLGLPEWMVRPVLTHRYVKPFVRVLTHPLLAVVGFNLVFSMYHLPQVFNYLSDVPILHFAFHWFLLLLAMAMWFPIFCPIREWDRMTDLQRMAYMFANGVLITPACAMIIFAPHMMFEIYFDAPMLISWLHARNDQQMGGVLMKLMQEIVYGAVLAYSFFKWFRQERDQAENETDGTNNGQSIAVNQHVLYSD